MDLRTALSKLVSAGAVALAVGCGAKVAADIDVNGATGDALTEAFFAAGVRENLPGLVSEDVDGDGNLDVAEDLDGDGNLDAAEDLNANGVLDNGEDLDGDGNLDAAEDQDGDGNLDLSDEDLNANGQIDASEVDINRDGVIDEQDNVTQSVFVLIASGGAVGCEAFADAFDGGADLEVDDTVLFAIGAQVGIGPNIPNAFSAGNVVEVEQAATESITLISAFAELEGGDAVAGKSAADEDGTSVLTIDKLGGRLSASLTATLVGDDGAEFSLSAEFKRVENCRALSDKLQGALDTGGQLELF
jgi:hypothetical protein